MNAPLPAKGPSSDVADGEALPVIADHVLIRRIGKGAYGEVWLAKNVIGGFRAAKVIYRRRFSDNRPFEREFEGIRKFEPISRTHAGLVTILQVGENLAAGYFYYVMELADDMQTGQKIETDSYTPRTLSHEMALHERIPLEQGLLVSLSLTSALGYLHSRRLIHRDIKPSNIIFVNGLAKFADIGLITEAGEGVSYVGSAGYMPPEGPGESTGDIYSLGKVFYGMFMGKPCKSFPELPRAAEEFTSTPALRQMNDLILKACHHDPRQRFQTAEELHEALVSVIETIRGKPLGTGAGLPARSVTSAKATPERQPAASGEQRPKGRWTRRVAVLMLLLAITGAVFVATNLPTRGPFVSTRDSIIPGAAPVIVLMDTIAAGGVYDEDNRAIGASNAKELYRVLDTPELPQLSLNPEPLSSGWNRESHVISLRPELVIIHRSSFFHSYNAELKFGLAPQFAHPTDDPRWRFLYNDIAEDKLITLLGMIGNAVPHTKFLVYSRGTDTNWLRDDFRAEWIEKVAVRYPRLKGRITTMVIPNGYNGSFRQPETRDLLRSNVTTILRLPEKAK